MPATFENATVPIDLITVRPGRQRQSDRIDATRLDPKTVGDLGGSIEDVGLMNPITVARDPDHPGRYILVSGERRLTSYRAAGIPEVEVRITSETNPRRWKLMELEENLRRKNPELRDEQMSWAEYYQTCCEEDPAYTQADMAKVVNRDRTIVSDKVRVGLDLLRGEDSVILQHEARTGQKLQTQSALLGLLTRTEERRRGFVENPHGNHTEPSIIHARFEDWLATYEGPLFNVIHCDFPYGIGFDRMGTQAGSAFGRYPDSPADYESLCRALRDNLDRIAAPDCHLVFWFSPKRLEWTKNFLAEGLGFEVDPHPLVWGKSDNASIPPDPNRGYRYGYEMAFFGRRGDRKIVATKSNIVWLPTTAEIHPHEKPVEVLKHFFGALVDDSTRLLDPTAGSGSALRAAVALRAHHVLGIEADAEFARLANDALEKVRGPRPPSAPVITLEALGL